MDAGITAMLLEDADPVIRGAIRRKLRVTLRPSDYREQNLDALDLLGDVRVKLLHKLGQFAEIDRAGIAEFRSYAATVAYHCCADYLRAKYPQRTSLKNCLRRLLDKADGYAAWTSRNGDVLCGFAGWQGGGAAATAEQVARLRTSPERLLEHVIPRASAQNISATDWLRLLEAVFDQAGGAIAIDDLITIVAPLTGVEDVADLYEQQEQEEDGGSALDRVASRSPDPYAARLCVERLKLFWGAVLQLLPWHRAAFLLNLRDGDLDALPYYGVVSIEGIGEAIELTEEQMRILERKLRLRPAPAEPGVKLGQRFAGCWQYLPLDDNTIAALLGVTRPQVIGYRNKAKERLARSLKGAEEFLGRDGNIQ
jgi:DNA-directed RNA polymerase specialized sigma24 family protein